MKTAVSDVVAYFCLHCACKGEISKARLRMMTYLADWKHCLEYGDQITDLMWRLGAFGPEPADDRLMIALRNDPRFRMACGPGDEGVGECVRYIGENVDPSLSSQQKEILNHVLDAAKKTWVHFVRLVDSTYPLFTSPTRGLDLDLSELAREYKKVVIAAA